MTASEFVILYPGSVHSIERRAAAGHAPDVATLAAVHETVREIGAGACRCAACTIGIHSPDALGALAVASTTRAAVPFCNDCSDRHRGAIEGQARVALGTVRVVDGGPLAARLAQQRLRR